MALTGEEVRICYVVSLGVLIGILHSLFLDVDAKNFLAPRMSQCADYSTTPAFLKCFYLAARQSPMAPVPQQTSKTVVFSSMSASFSTVW